MAAETLRQRLTEFYGLLPPRPVQERFLLASGEPLLASNPCEDL